MHRSITFSEILSSTFSNNEYDKTEHQLAKNLFAARIGIGLIEFVTATIFLSYGILFSEYVNVDTYTVENGLWTTILYVSAWNIAGPWSRNINEYAEIKGYNSLKKSRVFKYIICGATLLLSIGVLLPGEIICYGIFGGIFSNLITTQLKTVITEKFKTDLKVFEGNIHCAKALSLLIMPHVILVLVENFSMVQVKLIFAAFLLNVIPCVLFINPPRTNVEVDPEMNRYHTLPALSHQMREMMEFTSSNYTSDMNYSDPQLAEEDDDSSSQTEDTVTSTTSEQQFDEVQVEELQQRAPLAPSSVQDYFSKAGVAILPEIPEEKENDDDIVNENPSVSLIESKRLSKISAKLEELIQNERQDNDVEILNINDLISRKSTESAEKIQNIEYIPNYKENNNKFINEIETINIKACCVCPTYRIFKWRRKIRIVKDCVADNMFKPLCWSLKDLYFYPTLISKFSTTLVSTIFITLAPYLALEKNQDFKREDTAFLLSYIAFSWCLFLVLLPLIITFSKRKLGITYICGLLLSGVSMTLLSKKKVSNDFITLSCLLYGFGFGMMFFTQNLVYRSFIGVRRWKLLQGSLETLSAFLVLSAYYVIYVSKPDLIAFFPIAAFITYLINALLWIVLPVCTKTLVTFKRQYFQEPGIEENFL